MRVKTTNIRIPESVHERLHQYKNERKPHMSLNSLIVEAVVEKMDNDSKETVGQK